MVKTLVAILLGLGTAEPWPIPPQPLRQLFREADLVIVGKPGETRAAGQAEEFWGSSTVVLQIEKIIKGKCDAREITVFYCPNMVCPAPDQYPQGKTLLVFLTWSEKRKGYFAPGLSYASKVLEAGALKIYLERLDELARIPQEKRSEKPGDETVDWLVRCMEQSATRWEGAYEFFGPTVWVRRSQDDEPPEPVELKRLAKAQWKRILEAFVTSKTFGAGEDLVAMMLKDAPDPRIEEFMGAQLKRELLDQEPLWGGRIMKALAGRLGLRDLSGLAARFEGLDYKDKNGKLQLMREFLALMPEK
jgi:hypothetical protein